MSGRPPVPTPSARHGAQDWSKAPTRAAGAEPRAGPPVLRGRNEHGEHPPFDQPEHRDNRSEFRSGPGYATPFTNSAFSLAGVFHIMLDWISDPDLRRSTGQELNKGEARNSLARAVFIHRLGEIRDRTYENQQHRASGLNLLVTAIILWNTRYLAQAVAEQRQVEDIPDHLLAHLSPLGWEHVNLTGDYIWGAPRNASENPDGLQPLRAMPEPVRKAA
jgi:hypothetical protein